MRTNRLDRRHALLGLTILSLAVGALGCPRRPDAPGNPAGTPLLTLFYNAEEQPAEKRLVAQVIQSQLAGRGIRLGLEPVPSTVWNDRLGRGNFQATFSLWFIDYPDPEGYLTDFYSRASFRMSKYSNPEFDAHYTRGLFAPTPAEKAREFRLAAEIVDRDRVWVPLYSSNDLFLLRPGASGFVTNAYQYYDYRTVDLPDVRTVSDVEVQTLDPALAYDTASKHVVTQSYEGLIALDRNARVIPALATSWEFNPERTRLTFHLRPNVQFHPAPFLTTDGARTLDSGDVRASFERMLQKNSPYTYIFEHVVGVEDFKQHRAPHVTGFQTPDPATFVLELARPFPTMLTWLLAPASYVLPAETPADYDLATSSVGTGPFVLRGWNGTAANFTAHGGYWAATAEGRRMPFARTLTLRVVKDGGMAMSALRNGETDIVPLPLSAYSELFAADGARTSAWREFTLREVPLNNLKYFAFYMPGTPWGARADLRRRLSDAIDRAMIVRTLFRGHARVATSIIPPGVTVLE